MTENKKVTLSDWNNDNPISYIWFVSTANPTGVEYEHNVDTDDYDEYCDFSELDILSKFWDLEGTVTNGQWVWDGESGNPTDESANSITSIESH